MKLKFSKDDKIMLCRIFSSALLLLGIKIFYKYQTLPMPEFILYLIPYFIIGYDVVWGAITKIFKGNFLDERFLMMIATVGAFIIGEYPEGVFVMLFYQIGEFFMDYASDKSRESISNLMDINPEFATIKKDGEFIQVKPEEVEVGTLIYIKPGEKIPLDGVVIEGNSSVDTSSLTGESLPQDVAADDSVFSGSINISGTITVKTTKIFAESTVSKILELVEKAEDKKAKSENFITKFAIVYTPIVVGAAFLIGVLPPLYQVLLGHPVAAEIWFMWIKKALIFLVVSCPCALVLSIPLSFFGGIGGAASKGILIKGGNYLEVLAKTQIAVFDKTGTLTKGNFKVTDVHTEKLPSDEVLELAAIAEQNSNHPIAQSIVKEWKNKSQNKNWEDRALDITEIPGQGVKAQIDGKMVLVGNEKLMEAEKVVITTKCKHIENVIHVSVDGIYEGHLVIADEIKKESVPAMEELKKLNVKKIAMLTGDKKLVADKIASDLKIDTVYPELMPTDKVVILESLLKEKTGKGTVIYTGDGINDAPVIRLADAGIAMGSLGSDAAIEAADIVIMDDNPGKIPLAIKIAKKTNRIVIENIVFALTIKFGVMILGAFGLAGMGAAVFADVGVALIAVLNAIRTIRIK